MAGDNLPVLRKQTKEFIDVNPMSVIIQRNVEEADGAGGVRRTPEPLDPQIMRLIKQPTSAGVFRRTIDGAEVKPEFVLLGEWNANMLTGDWFFLEGRRCEIVYVQQDHRYESWGEVIYRG